MTATLEVCIDRFDAIEACVRGGADRIEACACLDLGGVTPSHGMLRALSGSPLPVHVLIRPRAGDFVYDGAEVRQMLDDIRAVADAGLAGVVVGASRRADKGTSSAAQALDRATMEKLVQAAHRADLHTTLHRVIDTLADPLRAVEVAYELGIGRILSSGGRARAIDGSAGLAELVNRAADRLDIMAGGGLDVPDVAPLADRSGVRTFHGSCRRVVPADTGLVKLGLCTPIEMQCDAMRVRAFRDAIDRL